MKPYKVMWHKNTARCPFQLETEYKVSFASDIHEGDGLAFVTPVPIGAPRYVTGFKTKLSLS